MKKNVLITGATGAIGEATALELAKHTGVQLILFGRNEVKLAALKTRLFAASGNSSIDMVVGDLGEPSSVKKAAEEIKKKYPSINVLLNIAAIYSPKHTENSKGHELMLATNHLGPFVLTNELLDVLKAGKPSRVINVSAPSFTKLKFDDLHGKTKFSSLYSFGGSKMMNLLFTYSLSRKLKDSGVTVNVFHPGLVKTELTKDMPFFLKLMFSMMSGKPDKAAKMLTALALDDKYETATGKFYKFDGREIKPSPYSANEEVQEKLWGISQEMVG